MSESKIAVDKKQITEIVVPGLYTRDFSVCDGYSTTEGSSCSQDGSDGYSYTDGDGDGDGHGNGYIYSGGGSSGNQYCSFGGNGSTYDNLTDITDPISLMPLRFCNSLKLCNAEWDQIWDVCNDEQKQHMLLFLPLR